MSKSEKISFQKNLKKYVRKDKIRMHMPGSKGKHLGFLNGVFKYDFTEISGMDNLYSPQGIIQDYQDEFADHIEAEKVFFLVNGSSSGVLSLLSLFSGKKVLMGRDFHISAGNAITLFNITPIYVYPDIMKETGIVGVISYSQVKKALLEEPDITAIYLTYPNYYGFCADIKKIGALAHENNIPIILDAAHSACFPYNEKMPTAPSKLGVDAWVTSMHKTLPSLNQAAYLAIGRSSLISHKVIKERINIFQTTSPSYLIMASIDCAFRYMMGKGKNKLENLISSVYKIEDKIDALNSFSVVKTYANVEKDPLKLVVDYTSCAFSRQDILNKFHKRGIYFEFIDTKFILFLLSPITSNRDLASVFKTLKALDKVKKTPNINYYPNDIPKALKGEIINKTIMIDFSEAIGYTCAQPIGVYPPGTPVVLKGDIITKQVVDYIRKALKANLGTIGIDKRRVLVYTKK
jgi:arginine/lysine/ornithine decarboxylase